MFSFLLSETGFALSRHGVFPIRSNELIKCETVRNSMVLAPSTFKSKNLLSCASGCRIDFDSVA
jgi:hypothetical protein